ncbi:MAG: hypothetical protein Q9209_007653 [Squamulea sp. 1 TL-2023]
MVSSSPDVDLPPPPPTSDIFSSASADVFPTCSEGLSCGPICCASSQYCSSLGQCVLIYDEVGSGGLTPTSETDRLTTFSTVTLFTSFSTNTKASASNIVTSTSDAGVFAPNPLTDTASATPTTTPSSTPASAPTSSSTTPITQTPKFKGGVSAGSIVFVFLLIGLFVWRRRKSRKSKPTTYPPTRANPPPTTPYQYDMNQPPIPNPYALPFPENRPHTDSSSHFGPGPAPDHDRGQNPRPTQPQMRHAPAHNPYELARSEDSIIPEPPFASLNQDRLVNSSVSPPPSYTTQDRWRGSRRLG